MYSIVISKKEYIEHSFILKGYVVLFFANVFLKKIAKESIFDGMMA